MTSNTAPSGECFGGTVYNNSSSYTYFKSFDGNTSTKYLSQSNNNGYIGYKFSSPIKVYKAVFSNQDASIVRIKNFKIQGSNDGTNYTDITSGQYPNNGTYEQVCIMNPSIAYQYYRLFIVDVWSAGNYIGTGEIQFYGR